MESAIIGLVGVVARLNKRLIKLADRLGQAPSSSIPEACHGKAEIQGAYRLFDQARAEKRGLGWEEVLAPHLARTERRMAEHPVVLCLQDTTELDFNGQEIDGLGRLSYEAQRGMYLHPTYAVTPERLPLGVLDAWMWSRPLDLSESRRWIEGYERVAERAEQLPATRLVYVADREADLLLLMQRAHALGHPADYLLRAQHNRCLPQGGKLWPAVLAATPLGEIEFTLPERSKRAARRVRQALTARSENLPDGRGGLMAVTCLIARETSTPEGQKPLEWRLLTNRGVSTLDEAAQLIDWYRCRWEIETLFHVLKNGCRIEELQLGQIEKLELALSIYLVVAWRLAYLVRLGRVHPDLPASRVFDPLEWQAAWILAEKPPPQKCPLCAKSSAASPCSAASSPAKATANPASKPSGRALPSSIASSEALNRCKRFMLYELCGMAWDQRPNPPMPGSMPFMPRISLPMPPLENCFIIFCVCSN